MTDATPEQLDLARKIADRIYPPQMVGLSCRENTLNASARIVALAAITETTERAAKAMENLCFFTPVDELLGMTKQEMSVRTCHAGATALRNQEHLK